MFETLNKINKIWLKELHSYILKLENWICS